MELIDDETDNEDADSHKQSLSARSMSRVSFAPNCKQKTNSEKKPACKMTRSCSKLDSFDVNAKGRKKRN